MEAVLSKEKSLKRKRIVFSEFYIVFLVCVIVPLSVLISPWLAIVISVLLGLIYMIKSDYKFLVFFVCFIFIQNLTLIAFADKFTPLTNSLFALSKEAILYLIIVKKVFFSQKKKKYPLLIALLLVFVALLGVSFITSSSSAYAKLLSIRQLLLPFVCFFFGFFSNLDRKEKCKLANLIVALGLIVSIIGLAEILYFKDNMWNTSLIEAYQFNKGTEFVLYNGVPLNFYTWDFVELFGKVTRRLVSVFADPLITGHFLFLCFVLVEHSSMKCKNIYRIIFLVSSLLTFSKGVYICFAAYIGFAIIKRSSYKTLSRFLKGTLIAIALLIPVAWIVLNRVIPNSSTVIHINGFINGIIKSSVLGQGIGKAGVVLSAKTDTERLTGESFVGVLSSQLGLAGLALYLFFFIFVTMNLLRRYKFKDNRFALSCAVLLTAVFLESFFSESSIGIIATGLYFTFAGLESPVIKKVRYVLVPKEITSNA